MQLVVVFCLCLVALSSGFRSFPSRTLLRASRVQELSRLPLRLSDDSVNNHASTEVYSVDRKNIESAAAVTGGVLGLVLLGPIGAVVLAAVANYVAKKEDEAGEAVRGFGKTALESFNFLAKLNNKFQLTGKVTEKVTQSIDNVASENETIGKVKETANTVVSKLDDINKEFDLVNKGKEVVAAAATLSDAAIEKTVELNKKYDFIGSAVNAAGNLLDKVREKVNSAE